MKLDIVDFAYQIIDLHEENLRLRSENEHLREYKQKYFDELDTSINHSKAMMGNLLTAMIDPNSRLNKMQTALAEKTTSKTQPTKAK